METFDKTGGFSLTRHAMSYPSVIEYDTAIVFIYSFLKCVSGPGIRKLCYYDHMLPYGFFFQ